MSETHFYMTKPGRQFYEVTMPELARELHKLNDLISRLVERVEQHEGRERANRRDGQKD